MLLQRASIEQQRATCMALRIEAKTPDGGEVMLPAAGLPWFLTLSAATR